MKVPLHPHATAPRYILKPWVRQRQRCTAKMLRAFQNISSMAGEDLQNESYDLFGTVLSLQPREQAKGGGMTREELIEKTCTEIQTVAPPLFDVDMVLKAYPTMYDESMNTVLTQECIRYNGLLNIMKISLRESLKALKGLVVMSNDLEMLCVSVFNNQVRFPNAAATRPPSVSGP